MPIAKLTTGVSGVGTTFSHTCVIQNGGILCMGSGGQLGGGSGYNSDAPVQVTGITQGATNLATGYLHTCAIVNGGVTCWGENGIGQLGTETPGGKGPKPVRAEGLESDATAVAAGDNHSCAIVAGQIYC